MASLITVNGNTINPDDVQHRYDDATEHQFIYIKANDDLSLEQKQTLSSLQVEIQEYIDDKTYKCKYLPSDLEVLRGQNFVDKANVFDPALKADKELKDAIRYDESRTEYKIDILLHESAPQSAADIAPEVARLADVQPAALQVTDGRIRATVHQDRIDDIAGIDSVNRIVEVLPVSVRNDFARKVLFGKQPDTYLLPDQKYQGASQTICVCDTGVDTKHEALKNHVDKTKLYVYGNNSKDGNKIAMYDPDGHGTHVCGSILGQGQATDSSGRSYEIKGTAPQAKLVMQGTCVWDKVGKFEDMDEPEVYRQFFENGVWTLGGLNAEKKKDVFFKQGRTNGAYVHSNSWGPSAGVYPNDVVVQRAYVGDIDRYTTGDPEMTIVMAAGNDGRKTFKPVIGAEAISKNCITVGASVTSRPDEHGMVANVAEPAKFTSRGPSTLGRYKPDVLAPGTQILSTGSSDLTPKSVGKHEYGGTIWNKDKKDWIYMSGTSMATPLVAGCVAVLREAFIDRNYDKRPSAALLKAMLVNGTFDLKGTKFTWKRRDGQTKDVVMEPAPNGDQGFGRVDLGMSLLMTDPQSLDCGFIDGADWKGDIHLTPGMHHSLSQGETWSTTISGRTASANHVPVFKASLVYPDREAKELQNYVYLTVRASNNSEKHGNMGDSPRYDQTNNVQKVVWEHPPAGDLTLEVHADKFLDRNDRQAFACAWMWQ